MPLGRGILEVFEAIPDRIEVSGHGPTWRVTGGSFDSVVSYANDAFDDPVVLAREDRSRWWPRVTLTVTVDAELAAQAPPLETFLEPEPEPDPEPDPEPPATRGPRAAATPAPRHLDDDSGSGSPLEEMFAHQEELRTTRRGIPRQRQGRRDA